MGRDPIRLERRTAARVGHERVFSRPLLRLTRDQARRDALGRDVRGALLHPHPGGERAPGEQAHQRDDDGPHDRVPLRSHPSPRAARAPSRAASGCGTLRSADSLAIARLGENLLPPVKVRRSVGHALERERARPPRSWRGGARLTRGASGDGRTRTASARMRARLPRSTRARSLASPPPRAAIRQQRRCAFTPRHPSHSPLVRAAGFRPVSLSTCERGRSSLVPAHPPTGPTGATS
jgi:hypothetical protein